MLQVRGKRLDTSSLGLVGGKKGKRKKGGVRLGLFLLKKGCSYVLQRKGIHSEHNLAGGGEKGKRGGGMWPNRNSGGDGKHLSQNKNVSWKKKKGGATSTQFLQNIA